MLYSHSVLKLFKNRRWYDCKFLVSKSIFFYFCRLHGAIRLVQNEWNRDGV